MAGTLLLLRPPAQAARLQAALASLGVASEPFCVLDTVADADGLAALPALARVSHWLVFVSPSAIDIAWPTLADKLPPASSWQPLAAAVARSCKPSAAAACCTRTMATIATRCWHWPRCSR